jgi:hypothetical protein
MRPIPPLAREALDQARSGALDEALATAERALEEHPDDARIHLFVGRLRAADVPAVPASAFPVRRAPPCDVVLICFMSRIRPRPAVDIIAPWVERLGHQL